MLTSPPVGEANSGWWPGINFSKADITQLHPILQFPPARKHNENIQIKHGYNITRQKLKLYITQITRLYTLVLIYSNISLNNT